jgi:hypothetical protein
MSYSGRSPFKDVVRSVLLGAAMISPAVLAACAGAPTPPANPEPLTVYLPDAGAVTSNTPDVAIADSGVPAPPDSAVRPRTPVGTPPQMPMRGFSGAARVRA